MGIQLPASGNPNIPAVPRELRVSNPELYDYLNNLRRSIIVVASGMFINAFTVATAINSGTSGVFVLSSGGSIIVTSGIVRTVTS